MVYNINARVSDGDARTNLLLHCIRSFAINPPPKIITDTQEEIIELPTIEDEEDAFDRPEPLPRWGRWLLFGLTVPWVIVLSIAVYLNPYTDAGPLLMGTHRQLGLPECNFKMLTTIPCPSCGMTTSFSLLMHADVWNSMKANFAGTALAGFGLLFVPWALASAFLGRIVIIRQLEMVVFRLAMVFLVMLFGRWAVVLIIDWFF